MNPLKSNFNRYFACET